MTLEEAQAEIVKLTEENTALKNECETLTQNNKQLGEEMEKVRTLNQQYFNKLTAQYQQPEQPEKEEPEVPSCEDFAKTLTI